VVSQSVILWDKVDIEMAKGLKGHTEIRFLSPAAVG
jgi:hypothetical protein